MNSRKRFWLGIVAVASLALYLLLAFRYPLGPSLADPRASWTTLVKPDGVNAALHLAIYLGITLLYMAALSLLAPAQYPQLESGSPVRWQMTLILLTWLACSAALLAVAPAGESHDIFDYIFRGRMMAEYQANPLAVVPDSFDLSTPYSRYLAWRKHVDTYGPVWEAASASVAVGVRQISGLFGWWDESYPVCPKSPESCRVLIVYITGYRMLAIILTGLAGWLIVAMVNPRLAPLALAAWLLNPMTLIATALGGHNDAVMLVLVLLCWFLLQRQRPYLAMLALILAAHVKLTALIWLPVCALWIIWKWGWKHALKVGLASLASGLALSWLLYAPFGGWQTLPRMLQERAKFLANSWWLILKHLLLYRWGWSEERAHQFSTRLPSWLFAVGALIISLWMFNFRPKRWRSASLPAEGADQRLWRTLIAVSMLYLVVGSFWFQPWYVLWVIAPAVLLPQSQFTRFMLPWLVFGALSSNVAMDFLLKTALSSAELLTKYNWSVAITWGPFVLAAIVLALLQRKGKQSRQVDGIVISEARS